MSQVSLNIFARFPTLGTVKTRMSPPLSSAQCLRLHRALMNHTLSRMQPLRSREIDLVLCLTEMPEDASHETRRLAAKGFGVDVQHGKHLGERLGNTLTARIREGYSKVIFIGTDCPRLRLETVRNAIDALSGQEVVIGPAKDGGYYLIGFASYVPEILLGIPWGTPAVYGKTVALLKRHAVRWKALEWEADLDTFEDLKQFCRQTLRDGGPKAGINQKLFATMEEIIQEVGRDSRGLIPDQSKAPAQTR